VLATVTNTQVVVWVNRKSGTAHTYRDCDALDGVPDAALREVAVEDGGTKRPLRFCMRCVHRASAS
jgi:hypothetical protein